jgi:hypothetical protein
MSRDDGFPVMDVSTSIVHDPKFRLLHRERPEHVPIAFLAYVAMLGESWKAGHRVSVMDAWPTLLPFDNDVVASMIRVKLIERSGLPPRRAWDGWYTPARERRAASRERWRRANENRRPDVVSDSDDTARLPRGTRDVPRPPSVPSVRPSVPTGSAPSVPTARARERSNGINPLTKEEERRLALEQASAEFKAGIIDELQYQRLRRELAS